MLSSSRTLFQHEYGTVDRVLSDLAEGKVPSQLMATDEVVRAMWECGMSSIARHMQIDSSIISLWCKRSRPIPGRRVLPLFDYLYENAQNFDPSKDLSYEAIAQLDTWEASANSLPEPVAPEPAVETDAPFQPCHDHWLELPEPSRPSWCRSNHGVAGVPVPEHHHGPAQTWGPGVITSTDQL